MSSVDVASLVESGEVTPFDKALFTIGKDIPAGQYILECVDVKSYSTEILLFDSSEDYTVYHKTRRFTCGEEVDAIEADCKASTYIQIDKSFSTYLKEGNILILDDGNVKISVME